jgi:hypothetical protein
MFSNRMKKHLKDVYGFEDEASMDKFFETFKAEDIPGEELSPELLPGAQEEVRDLLSRVGDEIINLHCGDVEDKMEGDISVKWEMSALCAANSAEPELTRIVFKGIDDVESDIATGGYMCAASVAKHFVNTRSVPAMLGFVAPNKEEEFVDVTLLLVSNHVKTASVRHGWGGIECAVEDEWRHVTGTEEDAPMGESFAHLVFGIINSYIEGNEIATNLVKAAPPLSALAVFGTL